MNSPGALVLPSVESLRGHEDGVRRIFSDTFALGRPLRVHPALFDRYVAANLDWFFERPEGGFVAVVDGEVVGYALVAPLDRGFERWIKRRSFDLGLRLAGRLATGRLDAVSRGFYRRRIVDAFQVRRSRAGADDAGVVHVHLNVATPFRSGRLARHLLEQVDSFCRAAGHSAWVGEINAVTGQRYLAIERLIGPVVHRTPSRTYSWLLGRPVERLTVVRTIT